MEPNNNGDPRHIAVILDGNGRWAEKHGVKRVEGHKAGANAVVKLFENITKYQIEYVTLYAFSTENWKRSKEEVDALMSLLVEFINLNLDTLKKNKIRLMATGRLEGLPIECRKRLKEAYEQTSADYERTLILALNYGGRAELVDAFRSISEEIKNGSLDAKEINESTISAHLYHADIPDPDLLIRTSGEIRLSNFLLWQLSYSEFYFTDTLWPDFDDLELGKAINTYKNRKRRFGGRVS